MVIIKQIDESHLNELAPLLISFRSVLNSFKGLSYEGDLKSAKEELEYYLDSKYPIYVAIKDNMFVGYIVLRISDGIVWVEQIYVKDEYKRQGIGSILFDKAEEVASSLGEVTSYNYVHPNNEVMINFLKKKGYTVLNLIEIRKPYKDEKTTTKIKVGNNEFDY